MTPVLKPYPAYKPSGIEWLGHIPAHWEVRKLRNILKKVTERNQPHLPLLSVVREKGVILRDITNQDENHNFIPDDLSNYKVVYPGQFVMNKMKAWQGSYGVSQHHGIVSPAYFIFCIRDIDEDYFHVAIRSKAYVPFFAQASDGVRIGQWDLSPKRMREIPFLVPSITEQAAIARYLDYVERRIRRYIDAKQKLVGLLEELKQATIYEAVTRGLDPDVPLKPSGVEWLGHIPAHWGKARVKYLCRFKYGDSLPANARIKGDIPVFGSNGPIGTHNSANTLSPVILIGRKGSFGKVNFSDRPCFAIDTTFYVDQHSAKADIRWLYYSLYLLRLDGFSQDSAIPGLNREFAHNQYLPKLPLPEQEAIAEYLDKETTNINTALNNTRREIELLQEYRTVLIADVVSGKVDVRDVAANLPDDDDIMADDSDAISEEVQK